MKRHLHLLLAVPLLITAGINDAFAQSISRRIEVGGGASVHRLTRTDSTTAGLTGRFAVDIISWLAAEAEVSFFPSDDITLRTQLPGVDFGLVYNRRRTDGLFGVKIGRRFNRRGVFGDVRPGFTHLSSHGLGCVGDDCARILMLSLPLPTSYRTEFALDVGGGVEFFPSARTVMRFELADTMIHHRSFAPPCWRDACTSHNVTTRIGGGMRF